MPALLDRGRTAIRDQLMTLITNVGVTSDNTAFAAAQTAIDPAGDVAANRLIKASAETIVDASTFDATMSINGDTEMTGKTIWTIAMMNGATRTDPLTRTVRTAGIGVQAGDVFTVGARVTVQDNSP